ncbi:MAG: hypothetical protein EAX95_04500 [Candidatus Thorarchaeota archaeon]|nr:hypothetical protein [Candidatus Thorarchaeota archaeon]
MKYEFVVAPYANPSLIQLRYPDADLVEVHKDTVTISKNGFTVADTGLMSFQEGGRACIVNSAFHSLDSGTIALSIGQHDSSCVLVIDPLILVSSTFLGGSGDDIALNIAVESGYVYVTGITGSVNFPPKSADDYALGGITDCYVVKYSTNLSSVIYSTYLGGSDSDEGRAIAVYNGFAYVTGITNSSDFPVENAFKDHYLGGDRDCYVTKLAANGQALIYSTFMGGNGTDIATGIAVQSGYAYITGYTTSTNFLTVNPYQQYKKGPWDSFLTKFATDGQSLVYSTYLGGSGNELAYDIAVEAGKAYLIGITNSTIDFPTIPTENAFQSNYQAGPIDGFVTKFTSEGQDLEYSTYLGGGGTEYPWAIAVESGYAYVVGQTSSLDFPTLNAYDSTLDGPGDGFVVKLSYDGLTLEYGTFLGGSSGEAVWSIAVEDGLAYVAGHTWSSDFPTVDALDSSYNGGADCFVAVLAAEGKSLIHSTFLGASGNEHISAITVEDDYIYVGGYTDSIDFPTEAGCDSTHNGAKDCFVAMICHQAATTTTTTDLGQMQLRLAATGAAATVIFGVFGFAFKSDMLEKKRYKGAICVFALLVFVAASYYLWTYLLP